MLPGFILPANAADPPPKFGAAVEEANEAILDEKGFDAAGAGADAETVAPLSNPKPPFDICCCVVDGAKGFSALLPLPFKAGAVFGIEVAAGTVLVAGNVEVANGFAEACFPKAASNVDVGAIEGGFSPLGNDVVAPNGFCCNVTVEVSDAVPEVTVLVALLPKLDATVDVAENGADDGAKPPNIRLDC